MNHYYHHPHTHYADLPPPHTNTSKAQNALHGPPPKKANEPRGFWRHIQDINIHPIHIQAGTTFTSSLLSLQGHAHTHTHAEPHTYTHSRLFLLRGERRIRSRLFQPDHHTIHSYVHTYILAQSHTHIHSPKTMTNNPAQAQNCIPKYPVSVADATKKMQCMYVCVCTCVYVIYACER